MKDLYNRLKAVGLDTRFVRDHVLPDWWEDSLAHEPGNRAQAEIAIARMLRVPIRQLRDPAATIELPHLTDIRLKKDSDTLARDLLPALILAEQVTTAILPELVNVPKFRGCVTAKVARDAILEHYPYVDLDSLLWFAWRSGIPVLHLAALPDGKRFSGLARFCGTTPVVVLASGRKSPPWLAFHLAHELGHIMRRHVTRNSTPLVDSNLDHVSNDDEEREADEFACELLTGQAQLSFSPAYGMTGTRLADAARDYGKRNRIDAGSAALMYGRTADRMPAAQNALKLLGMEAGAHERIARALDVYLPPVADLPDFALHCLNLVSTAD